LATALAIADVGFRVFLGAFVCVACWALGAVLLAVARWIDRPKE
jgi:hypothetical protein